MFRLRSHHQTNTVELLSSRLIGKAIHPDMQKVRKIGFLCVTRLRWQSEVEIKISTHGCFSIHNYLRTNKTLIRDSLYVFDNRGKNLSNKNM
jgi:hypothetical protein